MQLPDSVAWLFWVILQIFWNVCGSQRVRLQFHCIYSQVETSYHIFFNFKWTVSIIFIAAEHFYIFNNNKKVSNVTIFLPAGNICILSFVCVYVSLCYHMYDYVFMCTHVTLLVKTCRQPQKLFLNAYCLALDNLSLESKDHSLS